MVANYVRAEPANSPNWIDLARIQRTQKVFWDKHWAGTRIVLGAYSLPILCLHREIALELGGTGRLLVHIRDRILDTLAFVETVTLPSGQHSTGRMWIRRVRLTYALAWYSD
jgi:hypothetical protein